MLREWIIMPLFYRMNLRFSLVISVGMIIQFFYNLLTSSNNHLLLQFCRCVAHVLGPAPAKMVAMMVTFYHHRHLPWTIFSCSSWGIKEQWMKHYASLRRTQPMPTSRIRGQSQINIVHSRTFWRLSLLSLKRQKNRSRLISGWTLLNRSSICWGSPKWWRPSMHCIKCRGPQVSGGLIICLTYLLEQMLPRSNSRQPLGGIIYPQG